MPGTSRSGGRNKKSLRAHALAGTGRKDRGTKKTTTSAAEPDPPPGRPHTPSWLTGYALVEWDRMVTRLDLAKTLSTVDDAALYQYCCLFAETEAIAVAQLTNAALVLKLQAAIEKLRDGEQIVRAIESIVQLKKLEIKSTAQLRQGHMALRQYLVEFGMTPAARSRVKEVGGAPAEPTDPFAEFDTPASGKKH
jgi:P27 family predicted phage terminase small subunit